MTTTSPTILAEIALTSTHRFATRDLYVSDVYYKGTLTNAPELSESLADLYSGFGGETNIELEFADTDNGLDDTWIDIVAAEEVRGQWVKIYKFEDGDASATFLRSGKVLSYEIGKTFKLTLDVRQDIILDTELPKHRISTDIFDTTALDNGEPINICLGKCRNVPCRNVRNDTTNNIYDYLIGYGVIENIWETLGLGVKRDEVLVSGAEYTFYDGSQETPYSGYAFLRFTTEQKDFDGNYYQITADVRGMQMDDDVVMTRSFPDVIRNILSNSTWGLGDSVNTASFNAAKTILDDGYWRCEGPISEHCQARDILRDILAACFAGLERNESGEWELYVETTGSSVASFGDNDGYYNNCEVISVGTTPADETYKELTLRYSFGWQPALNDVASAEMSTTVHENFGVDEVIDAYFVENQETAKRVISRYKNQSLYSDKRITIRTGLEGRNLRRGDIVTVTAPGKGISTATDFIIAEATKTLSHFEFKARIYDSRIYDLADDITIPAPWNPGGSASICVYGKPKYGTVRYAEEGIGSY